MNKQDWLLLVIASGGSLSPVQLQKSMFLLRKELPGRTGEDFYEFEPYDYGPFNSAIYADAYSLQAEGLVNVDNPLERGWRRYTITDAGRQKAAKIAVKLPDAVREELSRIVSWVVSLPFTELIRTIYQKYPEYKVNSVFRG